MYSCRETEPQNKLIVNILSSSTGRLVACCIGLSVFGKVINNEKYVFISAFALVQFLFARGGGGVGEVRQKMTWAAAPKYEIEGGKVGQNPEIKKSRMKFSQIDDRLSCSFTNWLYYTFCISFRENKQSFALKVKQ